MKGIAFVPNVVEGTPISTQAVTPRFVDISPNSALNISSIQSWNYDPEYRVFRFEGKITPYIPSGVKNADPRLERGTVSSLEIWSGSEDYVRLFGRNADIVHSILRSHSFAHEKLIERSIIRDEDFTPEIQPVLDK